MMLNVPKDEHLEGTSKDARQCRVDTADLPNLELTKERTDLLEFA